MSDQKRFFVTDPVPGGNAWYSVRERKTKIDGVPQINWVHADFFRDMPNAREEAYALCARLNGERK